ncbi:cytoglobin-1-like [Saccoglossus kowalevskii]|uniref:Cytoglobin-1-like n=1 Tax=Saccoglossus kowalevskii TaxID=10224 RepID=A0A1C9TA57_SACKO|nr:PREDICTED: cytoglobin-1-like [Saccoglossus kowalevskii]AOR07028.1 cytoglobin-like protein [Saccoglossus kowalevskii]
MESTESNTPVKETTEINPDDIPDEVTILTPKEVKAISESWKVVYAKKKENGVALFIRLFQSVPGSKSLFKNLDGIDDEEKLRNHPRLKAHGFRVMSSVNSLIESLEEGELLVQLLKDLGSSHSKNKVTSSHFDALGPVIIWLLQKENGDSFTPAVKNAWLKGWGVMKSVIVGSLEEAYAKMKT